MCLIEVNTSIKPVVACGFSITNNIVINTNTKKISIIRESILEFLLINHPLDCPICDSAGECDLQDISLLFGNDLSRFREKKRFVTTKNFGFFIKTIMTRCIHCTRCIRFIDEYLFDSKGHIGTLGRGTNTIVSNYLNHSFTNDLSGNLADLCPVGALTHRTYAFTARPWELNSIEYIDFIENINMKIRVDLKGNDIYRIIPIYTKELNEEIISNKTRYFYDTTFNNNNNIYYIYYDKFFKYNKEISWNRTINQILKIKKNKIRFIINTYDIYTSVLLKFFYLVNDYQYLEVNKVNNLRNDYLLNQEIFSLISNIFLININLKVESSLFLLKLKKLNINQNYIGLYTNNFPSENNQIGISNNSYLKFVNGKAYKSKALINHIFNQILVSENAMIIKSDYTNTNKYINSNTNFNLYEIGFNNHFTKKNSYIDIESISNLYEINKTNIKNSNYDRNKISSIFKIVQNNLNINYFIKNKNNDIISSIIVIPSLTLFAQSFSFFNIYGKIKNNIQILKFKGFDDLSITTFLMNKKVSLDNDNQVFNFVYKKTNVLTVINKLTYLLNNKEINSINNYSKKLYSPYLYLNTFNYYSSYSHIENQLYTYNSKYLKNAYIYNKMYNNKISKTYQKKTNMIKYKKYTKKDDYLKINDRKDNFYDYFKKNTYY
jgi:hypothetical protein